MAILDNYVFDGARLLFVDKKLSVEQRNRIKEHIPPSDNYVQLMEQLNEFDENNMTARNLPIDQIGISLTYNCNLRCNYCSYSSQSDNTDVLSVEDILALVDEAIKKHKIFNTVCKKNEKPLRFFFTGGGEPTYNWSLFSEVVIAIKERCKKYGIESFFELTTNGMLSTSQQQFICNYFDKVMISYDGVDYLQNRNRKCANNGISSTIVENTLRNTIKCGIPVTVRSTIWQKDFLHLKKLYDNIVENFNGISEWSIMPILPAGRALEKLQDNEYQVDDGHTFFDYYIDLVQYSLSHKIKMYVSTPLFINAIADYCCGATFNECLWIMPDKTINNCIEAERFQNEVGKIENGKVKLYDCYHDSHLSEVRKNFKKCRDCIAYRFCKGGCPLKSLRDVEFNTHYKEYECTMIRNYWRYVFNQVLTGKECFGWSVESVTFDNIESGTIYRLVGNT